VFIWDIYDFKFDHPIDEVIHFLNNPKHARYGRHLDTWFSEYERLNSGKNAAFTQVLALMKKFAERRDKHEDYGEPKHLRAKLLRIKSNTCVPVKLSDIQEVLQENKYEPGRKCVCIKKLVRMKTLGHMQWAMGEEAEEKCEWCDGTGLIKANGYCEVLNPPPPPNVYTGRTITSTEMIQDMRQTMLEMED
jgi:hypothetical protein